MLAIFFIWFITWAWYFCFYDHR